MIYNIVIWIPAWAGYYIVPGLYGYLAINADFGHGNMAGARRHAGFV